MRYKVFLVEDEIVTREGIRDNVDWGAAGFEFCGEAPDGEIALPLLEEAKPDVLITDIKMPFMDGLQLSKIVREHMPWIKIIILSGHDEFNYAQSAVKLGVTEYLLKPISADDLSQVLRNLVTILDRENKEREQLKNLQSTLENNLVLSREKFLLKLVMGGVSSADAIEQGQQLGLDIVARYYLVVLIRIELCEHAQPFDYREYQRIEQLVSEFSGNNSDVFLTKKDLEELILLIRSDSLEQLIQESSFLADLIKREVEKQTDCNLLIEMGTPQQRLGDIHYSFAEALSKTRMQASNAEEINALDGIDKIDPLKTDHYLKFGAINEFDSFFSSVLEAISLLAVRSYLVKHYVFIDVKLTIAQFISDLGGDVDRVVPNFSQIEQGLSQINTLEKIKSELKRVFTRTLAFRDSQINHEQYIIIQQAKAFIDQNFADSGLQMNKVAAQYNLSPSYFSTLFRNVIGETFRDYLGNIKVIRAKELLRSTSMKCSEVAYHCGFNDPHYFSFVFKKKTGQTPQQFRADS